MSKVKTGLKDMPIAQKIQYGRQIIGSMTGNAHFPAPAPTLAAMTAAVTALETALNEAQTARQLAQSKTAAQNDLSAAMDLIFSQAANYVENTSQGDQVIIEQSGFSTWKTKTPVGRLPAPQSLRGTTKSAEGELTLKWNAVRLASSYSVEQSTGLDSPATWTVIQASTKSKTVVKHLTSGTKYWFRVAAIGAAGQGAWSDAVSRVVG